MRTGIGYDIHRLIPTLERQGFPLGGVLLPCRYQVQASSDGDVLLHAIVDACLGALALGDFDQWFSAKKTETEKRASSEFLKCVKEHIDRMGWRIAQVDSIVLLEEPKITSIVDAARENIARLLGIELSCVSVKARASEGLGAIGHRQAVAAHAVVTVEKR